MAPKKEGEVWLPTMPLPLNFDVYSAPRNMRKFWFHVVLCEWSSVERIRGVSYVEGGEMSVSFSVLFVANRVSGPT